MIDGRTQAIRTINNFLSETQRGGYSEESINSLTKIFNSNVDFKKEDSKMIEQLQELSYLYDTDLSDKIKNTCDKLKGSEIRPYTKTSSYDNPEPHQGHVGAIRELGAMYSKRTPAIEPPKNPRHEGSSIPSHTPIKPEVNILRPVQKPEGERYFDFEYDQKIFYRSNYADYLKDKFQINQEVLKGLPNANYYVIVISSPRMPFEKLWEKENFQKFYNEVKDNGNPVVALVVSIGELGEVQSLRNPPDFSNMYHTLYLRMDEKQRQCQIVPTSENGKRIQNLQNKILHPDNSLYDKSTSREAFKLLQQNADQGHVGAMRELGAIYSKRTPVIEPPEDHRREPMFYAQPGKPLFFQPDQTEMHKPTFTPLEKPKQGPSVPSHTPFKPEVNILRPVQKLEGERYFDFGYDQKIFYRSNYADYLKDKFQINQEVLKGLPNANYYVIVTSSPRMPFEKLWEKENFQKFYNEVKDNGNPVVALVVSIGELGEVQPLRNPPDFSNMYHTLYLRIDEKQRQCQIVPTSENRKRIQNLQNTI